MHKKSLLLILFIFVLFFIVGCNEETNDVSYTVKFDTNCDLIYDNIVLEEKTTINLPVPSKFGYIFAGWYPSEKYVLGTEVTNKTVISKDITLYAKWNPIPLVVTYDLGGGHFADGTSNKTVTAYYNESASFERAYLDNHLFMGWYIGDEEVTEDTVFTSDVTVTAKYLSMENLKDSYSISLEYYDGYYYSDFWTYIPDSFYGVVFTATKCSGHDHIHIKCPECNLCIDANCNGKTEDMCSGHEEHVHTKCSACELCVDKNCTGEAIEKCQGHSHIHRKCSNCGLCIDANCDGTDKEKCQGHSTHTHTECLGCRLCVDVHCDGLTLAEVEQFPWLYRKTVTGFMNDLFTFRNELEHRRKSYTRGNFFILSKDYLIGQDGFFGNQSNFDRWVWLLEYLSRNCHQENRVYFEQLIDGKYEKKASNYVEESAIIAAEIHAFFNGLDNYSYKTSTYETGDYSNKTILYGFDKLFYVYEYKTGEGIVLLSPYKRDHTFLGWYDNPEFEGEPITEIKYNEYGDKTYYAYWLKRG